MESRSRAFPNKKIQNSAGFSLIEILLAIGLLALLTSAFAGVIIYSQQTTVIAGQRARANQLAEEGLEAIRNIRDEHFSNLNDGTFGLEISGGTWQLTSNPDTTGIYTRHISISPYQSYASTTKEVLVTVTWQEDKQHQGNATAETILSDWRGN